MHGCRLFECAPMVKHRTSLIGVGLLAFMPIAIWPFLASDRRTQFVDAIAKVQDSVVTIKAPDAKGTDRALGTGIIIDDRGVIITAGHVVKGHNHIHVYTRGEDIGADADVIETDPKWDLSEWH